MISRYALKPMPQIRRELEAILSHWSRPFLELADDNTFVNKAWGRELARLLAEYPLRWFTETDISVADDPELLELLARSNCAELLIGFESASATSLNAVDSRGWKRDRWARTAESIARIQSFGIAVNGCFVLGFDPDDASVFDRTRDYVEELGLADVQVTVLTPFPGTKLHRDLQAQGRLLKPVYWDECTLFDVTYTPARMSPSELEAGFRSLMRELYLPEKAERRKMRFRDCVRVRHEGRTVRA